MKVVPDDAQLIFRRLTQVGLLRLLMNTSIMGGQTLTLRKGWGSIYTRLLWKPRVANGMSLPVEGFGLVLP